MAAKTPKTSLYKWEGKNRQGASMSGQMAGQDAALVKAQLRKQGINPIKVRKKGIELFSAGKKNQTDGCGDFYSANGHDDESRCATVAVV